MPEDRWLSIEKARQVVGVSRRTLYYWINKGAVETRTTVSGRIRVLESSLWRDKKAKPRD
jgi:predicted site-specific integrase-resolvase